MDILELRNPEIAINTAIEIIEQIEDIELEKLLELYKLEDKDINIMSDITYTTLFIKQYQRLINKLELIRDFISEQLKKVIKTELMDKKDNEKENQ